MTKLISFFVLAVGFCIPSPGRCDPPTEYPVFDNADVSPVLVVAKVRPGKYMSQFPECDKPDTICMDPPPFWFEATVTSTVYGFAPPRELQVATTSHYGMPDYEAYSRHQLVLLKTDGRHFVMPRYASTGLVEDTRGKLYLVVVSARPVWWLPCSVAELKQEIEISDFKADLEIAKDHFSRDVEENPEFYRLTKNGAVPRFAIPVENIRAHLQSLAPDSSQMSCELEDKT